MYTLWKHILRAHIAPFLFSFSVLMLVFLLQYITKFLDQLAGKGLTAGVIAEFVALSLAWMVVLAVPMSVLIATLMAFGNMSSGNEITAMRASGVSLYFMMSPVLLASFLLCLALVHFNNEVLPDANHHLKVLTTSIYRKKPTMSLVPGLFSQEMQGYSILARKTFEHSNDLEGVTIFDYSRFDKSTTVTAQRGSISFSPDYRKLVMDLYDGEIHELSLPDMKVYRKIRFEKHRIALDAEGFSFQRLQENAVSRGDREMSAQAMRGTVDSLRALEEQSKQRMKSVLTEDLNRVFTRVKPGFPGGALLDPSLAAAARFGGVQRTVEVEYEQQKYLDRQIREYTVEIDKKYAIPIACIVFVLIGVPLGIMARRGTFGTAASLSLAFFLLYWACLIGGEKLGDRGFMPPWVGMWAANMIIGTAGIYLTIRSARESLTIDWSKIARVIPKAWRSEGETTVAT